MSALSGKGHPSSRNAHLRPSWRSSALFAGATSTDQKAAGGASITARTCDRITEARPRADRPARSGPASRPCVAQAGHGFRRHGRKSQERPANASRRQARSVPHRQAHCPTSAQIQGRAARDPRQRQGQSDPPSDGRQDLGCTARPCHATPRCDHSRRSRVLQQRFIGWKGGLTHCQRRAMRDQCPRHCHFSSFDV